MTVLYFTYRTTEKGEQTNITHLAAVKLPLNLHSRFGTNPIIIYLFTKEISKGHRFLSHRISYLNYNSRGKEIEMKDMGKNVFT